MSRVTYMQTAFNGGELSRYMHGRPDHQIWPVALDECVGWAPRPQGPLEACPGFEYVATAPGAGRLLDFEPNVTQGYVVEATNLLFRFYTNDVLLESSGSPVTVTTPYTAADLSSLDYEPSEDIVYLWHGSHQPRQLVRTAADAFTLETIDFENGPFLDRNTNESHTLSFSGVAGSVTVTSSQALFASTDVGRLIEVEAHDLGDVPSWEPGITTDLGAVMQWDGRVYQIIGGRTLSAGGYRTGTVAPVHTRGTEWDGIAAGDDINEIEAGGVQLQYMHDMFGRLEITGYTSATVVTATVTRRLPLQTANSYTTGEYTDSWWTAASGYSGGSAWTNPGGSTLSAGTWRWRLGAFSDTTGWPEHGRVHNQRLYLFKGNTIYASVAGALTDFDRLNEFGEISLDQAFTLTLDDPHSIEWALAEDELFFGTAVSEWVLRQSSAAQGIGPGNTKLVRQPREGAASGVRPVSMNGRPIFLQRSGRALMQLVEETVGRFVAADLTRYADHIGKTGFVDLAWQKRPMRLLWALLGDGSLAAAAYLQAEGVLGWFRRPLGSGLTAESICTITAPDGKDEQLWVLAHHAATGNRFVMVMDDWRRAGDEPANPIMCDAALTATSGTPFSTITLAHLPNTTVGVIADGQWLGDMTTNGSGQITLAEPATSAMAGLNFDAYFKTLPPEAGGDNGPAQFKNKRACEVALRVEKARALQIEDANGKINQIVQQTGGDDIADPPQPVSEDRKMEIVGTWDTSGAVTVRRYAPFQATVLGMMITLEVGQR